MFVGSRARSRDYRFLPTPTSRWWEPYGGSHRFEGPTLIIEGSPSSARAYVGGLRTSRQDFTGTFVRLSLVVENARTETDFAAIERLVYRWLNAVAEGAPQELGESLSALIGTEALEDWFSADAPPEGDVQAAATRAIREATRLVKSPDATSASGDPPSGCVRAGGLQDRRSREEFWAFASRLLRGGEGAAVFLSLAPRPTSTDALQASVARIAAQTPGLTRWWILVGGESNNAPRTFSLRHSEEGAQVPTEEKKKNHRRAPGSRGH